VRLLEVELDDAYQALACDVRARLEDELDSAVLWGGCKKVHDGLENICCPEGRTVICKGSVAAASRCMERCYELLRTVGWLVSAADNGCSYFMQISFRRDRRGILKCVKH
jgi:hypothetical protein